MHPGVLDKLIARRSHWSPSCGLDNRRAAAGVNGEIGQLYARIGRNKCFPRWCCERLGSVVGRLAGSREASSIPSSRLGHALEVRRTNFLCWVIVLWAGWRDEGEEQRGIGGSIDLIHRSASGGFRWWFWVGPRGLLACHFMQRTSGPAPHDSLEGWTVCPRRRVVPLRRRLGEMAIFITSEQGTSKLMAATCLRSHGTWTAAARRIGQGPLPSGCVDPIAVLQDWCEQLAATVCPSLLRTQE